MALVSEKDGSETVGGIISIRDAFVKASDKKLVCLDCVMSYDHDRGANGQAFTFSGYWTNEHRTPYEVTVKVPPGAAAAPFARMAARQLVESKE